MTQYELLYILPAKFTDAELKDLSEKIAGVITNLGAKITATQQLGSRKMSYAINQVRNGSYVLVHFDAETSSMAKINETLRLSTDLLRHMIVVRDPKITTIPSIMLEERVSNRRDEPTGTVSNNMAMASVVDFGGDAAKVE